MRGYHILQFLLVLAILSGRAAVAGALDLSANQNYIDPLPVGTDTTVTTAFGPGNAATITGDITGPASSVLTVDNAGGGTLRLRGDNTAYQGSLVLTGGTLDVTDASQLPAFMSSFRFAGSAGNRAVLAVGAGGDVRVDGAGAADQRLVVASGAYGGIQAEGGAFTLSGSAAGTGTGGALLIEANADFVLDSATGNRIVFANNQARYGGAVATTAGSVLTGARVDFTSNQALGGSYSYIGGAIWNRSSVTLAESSFVGNQALNGGAIYSSNGVTLLTDTDFINNEAQESQGGAVANISTGSGVAVFSLERGEMTNNRAGYQGGAIHNERGLVTLTGVAVNGNKADSNGGGIYNNDGTVTLTATSFDGNYARSKGGALYNDYRMTLDGGTDGVILSNNAAGRDGGGIYNQNGVLTLTDVSFLGNSAGRTGGAIFNWSGNIELTVGTDKTATFSGNTANGLANSIHTESYSRNGSDSRLDFTVQDGGVLDMRDPMSGIAGDDLYGPGNIAIDKSGDGQWRLGGASRFVVDPSADNAVSFTHRSGDLYFYREGELLSGTQPVGAGAIHLEGAGSRFSMSGLATKMRIGGGNAITVTGNAADWQNAAAEGTIELFDSPTFSFDMSHAVPDEAMLTLKADTITIAAGRIIIDVLSLGELDEEYLLVQKINNQGATDFNAGNVTVEIRLRGREFTGGTIGRAAINNGSDNQFEVRTEDDQIYLSVLDNSGNGGSRVLYWANSSSTWDLVTPSWTAAAGSLIPYYLNDVVNFNLSGSGNNTVTVGDDGVTVSGMYVSGNCDYTFTGNGILAVDSAPALEGPAVSGKLVLGAQADATTKDPGTGKTGTVVNESTFRGTVDFTGITEPNYFLGGIDIHTGKLAISNANQIRPGLGKTAFLGDMMDFNTTNKAIAGGDAAADILLSVQNSRNFGDYLPTLVIRDTVTFDNAGDEQRLVVANDKAGSIDLASGKHALFQNAADTALDGGAIAVEANALLALTSDTGSLYRFRNNRANGGGAVANAGTFFSHRNEFTGNTAGTAGGGAILNTGVLRLEESTFTRNRSGGNGGAVHAVGAALTDIRGAAFTENAANGHGGAIASDSDLDLTDTSFRDNRAEMLGGAVYATGDVNLTVSDGQTHSFIGNRDRDGANSFHLEGTLAFTAAVGDNATLDLRDPMTGTASGGPLNVNFTGGADSTIALGGVSVFSGGATHFTATGGTFQLYRDGETDAAARAETGAMTAAGSILLDGAGSTFTLGAGTNLLVGGNNILRADGGITLANNTTVTAGLGHNDAAKITFSDIDLAGTTVFTAAADKTLALHGVLNGDTFEKTGAGEVFLARTGNNFQNLNVTSGILGVVVGDDVAARADNVTFAGGTTLNIGGFTGQNPFATYTVIQSGGVIASEPSTVLVGGQNQLDFLTATAERSTDQTAIEVTVGLTWYDNEQYSAGAYSRAHGTFTLDGTCQEFLLGIPLSDRTGVFASGWDGRTLTKKGAGALTLSGDNSYTGDTIIEAGTLTVTTLTGAGDNDAERRILNSGVFGLDIAAADGGDFHKTLSGGGQVVKDGDGYVRLTGDNRNLSGQVSVRQGELVADNQYAFGTGTLAILDRALLDFDGLFANRVAGTGILETSGDIVLAGNHAAHNGRGVVRDGTITMANGFASGAAYDVYGTLAGNGRVEGLTIHDGGRLSPGNSFGIIMSSQGATFKSGSTYAVELDASRIAVDADHADTRDAVTVTDASDVLVVDGVTAIEAGARLEVMAGGLHTFSGAVSDRAFRIIHGLQFADDTLFTAVSNSIGLSVVQEILPDGYYLRLGKTAPDFGNLLQGRGTPNARRAAAALTEIVRRGDGHLVGGLYGFIASLPNDPEQIAAAFSQAHGEVFASGQDAAVTMQRHFLAAARRARALTLEERRYCPLLDGGWFADAVYWAAATGGFADRRGDNGYSAHDVISTGFAVGMDKAITNDAFLGLGFGYDHGRQRYDSLNSRDDIDSFRALLYGGRRLRDWDVDAYIGYGKNWHRTRRNIALANSITGFSARPDARYSDNMVSAGFSLGRELDLSEWRLRPSLGMDYFHLWTPSLHERNGQLAELGTRRSSLDIVDATVGMTAVAKGFVHGNMVWRPELRAFYTRHLGDDKASVTTHFLGAPDILFEAKSGRWSKNSARLGASLEGRWRDRFSFRADYDFRFGERFTAHEVSLAVGWEW